MVSAPSARLFSHAVDLRMDVRCDRCQTEYELEDESVGAEGASVQCTNCGHTFLVSRGAGALRGGEITPPSPPSYPPPSATSGTRASSPSLTGSSAGSSTGASAGASHVAASAGWMLTTEEGKTHRFRDPTTLQKWIVERRVGRTDRVKAPGAAWRLLGEMDDLRPFFEVVDQADRVAARGGRPTRPETPRRMGATARPYVSPDEDDDDILTSDQRQRDVARPSRTPGRADYPGRGDAGRGGQPRRNGPAVVGGELDPDVDASGGFNGGLNDSLDMALFHPRHTGRKVVVGAVIVALAALAAYLGFKSPRGVGSGREGETVAVGPASSSPSSNSSSSPSSNPPSNPVPSLAPGAPPVAPNPPPAGSPSPAAAAAPSVPPPAPPAPAAAAPPIAPARPAAPAPAAALPPPTAAPVAAPPPVDEPSPRAGRPAARGTGGSEPIARPRSYEQLVAEADRALENGSTGKADKLFADALRLQPNGVAAMTGAGYVLLDKQKPLAAIGMFKRALNNAPTFPQALFGLGEAYRSQGNPAAAVDAYKKYLSATPGGSDAPAARRQLRDLEEQLASRKGAEAPREELSPPPVAP
jgi:predicted Zn finger-like uncharacterized protein